MNMMKQKIEHQTIRSTESASIKYSTKTYVVNHENMLEYTEEAESRG